MVASRSSILRAAERLSHAEACRLSDQAVAAGTQTIVLDLSRVTEATTAAFARLVILRRDLLQRGRDVRLAGLRGLPAQLFEVHRLQSVLPRISELPVDSVASAEPVRRRHEARLSSPTHAVHCLLQ